MIVGPECQARLNTRFARTASDQVAALVDGLALIRLIRADSKRQTIKRQLRFINSLFSTRQDKSIECSDGSDSVECIDASQRDFTVIQVLEICLIDRLTVVVDDWSLILELI
jgi:hypothetical protein